jgi:dipeptidyl aminopeptidase/acylaminoacyl peptidase
MKRRRLCRGMLCGTLAMAILGAPLSPASAEPLKGLTLEGDKFTFSEGGLTVKGILVKPAAKGAGKSPAILISHGMGSNGERFGLAKAREFAKAGYVCIACDYAHSEPKGDRKNFGSSPENLRRAKKCLDILESLPEVDKKRICAYGNSMGAFLTIGLAAEEPNRVAAAAITAGGVNPVAGFPAPAKDQAAKIKTPMLILHGDKDTTVPPERSKLLEEVLKENKVTHERHVYEGVEHDLHMAKAQDVNAKIEAWFAKYAGGK